LKPKLPTKTLKHVDVTVDLSRHLRHSSRIAHTTSGCLVIYRHRRRSTTLTCMSISFPKLLLWYSMTESHCYNSVIDCAVHLVTIGSISNTVFF